MNELVRPGGALEARAVGRTIDARWAQVAFASSGLGIVVRVSELGGVATADVWVAELATGRTWAERSWGPVARSGFGLEVGAGDAHVIEAGARARIRTRGDAGFEVLVNVQGLTIEATIDGRHAPAPTRIVARDSGRTLVRRHAGLALGGRVRVGSEARALGGEEVMIEMGDLVLPQAVRWSSAALFGRPAAYLSDLATADEPGDNVVWSGAGARALGAADFGLPEPRFPGRGPWSIGSRDGRVALAFTPRAVRVHRSPGRAAHTHAWVFGTLAGRVDEAVVEGRLGLCEARDWA